jgi:arylsulfatase A-like enzyme
MFGRLFYRVGGGYTFSCLPFTFHPCFRFSITPSPSGANMILRIAPCLIVCFLAMPFSSLVYAASKPNVLVILADDLGWGELGCQGFTHEVPTPHIDSIAASGVRFTSGYVSGPYCSPTRAGLMTGRYQQRFGHEFNPGPAESAVANFGLPLSEKTFADHLRAAGYVTGWIGKSHLGYEPPFHPMKRGFDQYFGFLGGAHDYFNPQEDAHNPILRGHEKVSELEYTTDAFGREAASFIETNSSKPWFCYLAFNAVHAPMQATEKYLKRFSSVTDPRRKAYCAMESAMDDAVGLVLDRIRSLGQEENTLIFFFSDNGGPTPSTTSGNGPLRGFKSQTWEGGIRVPYLLQWKGHVPGGKVDDRPVIQLDVLPTALAAAGATIPPNVKLDGVNLLPFVQGERNDAPHASLFWRFGPQIAIRMGDWKLVKGAGMAGTEAIERQSPSSTTGAELYNLHDDIGETKNLANSHPEKFKALADAWDRWNSELVEPAWIPNRKQKASTAKKGKGVRSATKASSKQ